MRTEYPTVIRDIRPTQDRIPPGQFHSPAPPAQDKHPPQLFFHFLLHEKLPLGVPSAVSKYGLHGEAVGVVGLLQDPGFLRREGFNAAFYRGHGTVEHTCRLFPSPGQRTYQPLNLFGWHQVESFRDCGGGLFFFFFFLPRKKRKNKGGGGQALLSSTYWFSWHLR